MEDLTVSPRRTASIMMFSEAMKGSSSWMMHQ